MADVSINKSYSGSADYSVGSDVAVNNVGVSGNYSSQGVSVSTTSVAYTQPHKGIVESMDLSLSNPDSSSSANSIASSTHTMSVDVNNTPVDVSGSTNSINSVGVVHSTNVSTTNTTNNYNPNFDVVSGDGTSS